MTTTANKRSRLLEEIFNAVSHGIGAILAIVGLIFLVVVASPGHTVWFAVYGATLIALYLASTLYHSLIFTRARAFFRKLDHIAIFLLIAGTYTPFCMLTLDGWVRWVILAGVWSLALGGVIFKIFFTGRLEWLSLTLYVAMGWIAILAIVPIYQALSTEGFALLMLGGVAYTAGTWFYARSSRPYQHAIWHIFVLLGSVFHFLSVATLA